MTCAVSPNILKLTVPVITKGIDTRISTAPRAVVACENAIGPTDTLASFIHDPSNLSSKRLSSHDQRARLANSAIDRIISVQKPNAGLNVKIESSFEWVVDKTLWKPRPEAP